MIPSNDSEHTFSLDAPESDGAFTDVDDDGGVHSRGSTFAAHLRHGKALLASGDPTAAARALEKALRIAPDASSARHFLALACFAAGDAERALSHYEAVVETLPASATARTNLAVILLRLGRAAAARTVLTSVLDAEPGHRPAWGYLGVALEQLGLLAEAEEAFLAGDVARIPARLRVRRPPGEAMRSSTPTSPDVAFARSQRPGSSSVRARQVRTRAPAAWPSDGGAATGILGAVRARFLATMRAPAAVGDPGFDATPAAPAVLLPFAQPCAPGVRPAAASPVDGAKHLVVTLTDDDGAAGFAARADAICATAGSLRRSPLSGRLRAATAALRRPGALPLEHLAGRGRVVLAPPGAARLVRIVVGPEGAFVRPDLIVGLELSIACSAAPARQAVRDAPPMVRLRGEGVVILAPPAAFVMLDVEGDERVTLGLASLIGWVGAFTVTSRARADAGAGEAVLRFRGAGSVLIGA